MAITIEDHYGLPVDVEWAKDGYSGELYIVQARPETVHANASGHATIQRFRMEPALVKRLSSSDKLLLRGHAVGSRIGAGHVLDHVSRFGFGIRDFPRNTQLAIGGGTMAVTPLAMARAYAVLANGGYLVEPHIIREIRDVGGNVIFQPQYPVVCHECESLEVDEGDAVEEPTSLLELP